MQGESPCTVSCAILQPDCAGPLDCHQQACPVHACRLHRLHVTCLREQGGVLLKTAAPSLPPLCIHSPTCNLSTSKAGDELSSARASSVCAGMPGAWQADAGPVQRQLADVLLHTLQQATDGSLQRRMTQPRLVDGMYVSKRMWEDDVQCNRQVVAAAAQIFARIRQERAFEEQSVGGVYPCRCCKHGRISARIKSAAELQHEAPRACFQLRFQSRDVCVMTRYALLHTGEPLPGLLPPQVFRHCPLWEAQKLALCLQNHTNSWWQCA